MSSNIDAILDGGNAIISAAQSALDWKNAPAGVDKANLLVSAAGVVAGILTSEAGHAFTRSLASATNFNVAVLAVATNGMQLAEAIRVYNAAPESGKGAALQGIVDKFFGTVGAIGAAIATVPLPQTRTLGLSIWGVATLLQHTYNGNIGNLLTHMGQEMWSAFSSVLSSSQGQSWTKDLAGNRAISGSVMGQDWTRPGWQGTDRSIVIAWHEFDAQGRSVSYRSTISVATGAALADIMRSGGTDYHVEAAGQRPGESFSGYVDRVNSGLTSMGGGGWQTWNGDIDAGGSGGSGGRNKLEQFAGDDPDYGLHRGAFRFAPVEDQPLAVTFDQGAATLIDAMASFGATELSGDATRPASQVEPLLIAVA